MLPPCSLARLLCQMKLTGGWAGQQILFHFLLKLEHLRGHSGDQKFVLSDSNHVKFVLCKVLWMLE
jgi:predicted phage-related endonuclease